MSQPLDIQFSFLHDTSPTMLMTQSRDSVIGRRFSIPRTLNMRINPDLFQAINVHDKEFVLDLVSWFGVNAFLLDTKGCYSTFLIQGIKASDMGMVEALLARGADIHVHDEYLFTPLMQAILQSNEAMVTLLIRSGANVNQRNLSYSPLLLAVQKYMPQYPAGRGIVRMLLENGADPNPNRGAQQRGEWSALHWAISRDERDMLDTLLEEPDTKSVLRKFPDIEDRNNFSLWSPLMVAAFHPNLNMFHYAVNGLHALGVMVNGVDGVGRTVLHGICAARHSYGNPFIYYTAVERAQKLLEVGASMVALDHAGFSPMHLAIHAGNLQLVQLFIRWKDGTAYNLLEHGQGDLVQARRIPALYQFILKARVQRAEEWVKKHFVETDMGQRFSGHELILDLMCERLLDAQ